MDVWVTFEEFEAPGAYHGSTVLGVYVSEELAMKELELCAKQHGTVVRSPIREDTKEIAYVVFCENDSWNGDSVNCTERLFREHVFGLS